MSVLIRPSHAADIERAIALLTEAGLPVDDLSADKLAFTALRDGAIEGVIGVEHFGSSALLRSLVIAESARGHGIGARLVAALEAECRVTDVAELWLLTIDADRWFSRLGYTIRSRSEAPASIRTTREFAGLCPDDAVLMSKTTGQ